MSLYCRFCTQGGGPNDGTVRSELWFKVYSIDISAVWSVSTYTWGSSLRRQRKMSHLFSCANDFPVAERFNRLHVHCCVWLPQCMMGDTIGDVAFHNMFADWRDNGVISPDSKPGTWSQTISNTGSLFSQKISHHFIQVFWHGEQLVGGFKHFLFFILNGIIFPSDWYFSRWLKPSTRQCWISFQMCPTFFSKSGTGYPNFKVTQVPPWNIAVMFGMNPNMIHWDAIWHQLNRIEGTSMWGR